jgi:outer membrane receptor protein involved in Fe transport
MRQYPCRDAVKAMTAAVMIMLRMSVQGQTVAPSPNAPGQTNNQNSEVNVTNTQTNGGQLEQVTVTGYLIPRVGEGPQPVETLTHDFTTKQAYQSVNDVLNNYPGGISQQNALTFAGNSNSPASSAFGLKALPANATSVLIDGYRYPNYPIPINSTETFVDINSIPLAAIDRIEILKDGGSATYGDDAVAGVVNIILKDEYNGADIVNYIGETGITFNYVGGRARNGGAACYHFSLRSELDFINSDNGTVPAASAGLNPPGYVHLIGNWTTWDYQISYQFGPPVEVTPETPKPGYNKEGKQVVGEKAIAPAPETTHWGWRRLLDNLTLTFGIKNVFDTRPPLAVQANGAQGYDPEVANPIQRFFYGQIEKKF